MTVNLRVQPGCCPNCAPCTNCDESDCIECSCCLGGLAARQISVIVPPMSYAGLPFLPCNCENYAGEYIMQPGSIADSEPFCFPPQSVCFWKNEFDTLCGRSIAHLILGCGPDTIEAQFAIMPTECHAGGQFLRWSQVFAASPATFNCCFQDFTIAWPAGIGPVQCVPVDLAPVVLNGLNCTSCVPDEP